MLTLGVDLASQPKRTGTCLIRWDSTSAHVERLSMGATDSDLHELFGCADKIGIDAPFGWPVDFARAIANYSSATVWPPVALSRLRFRRTDEVVKEKLGRWPLSVSSDLIAVPAMRAVRLLAETAATVEAIDRSGGGRFVESYPAAALSAWGFPTRGYKGARGAAVRARLVSEFAKQTMAWLTLSEERRSLCRTSDEVLDALLAASRPSSGSRVLRIDSALGSRSGCRGGLDRAAAARQPQEARMTRPRGGRLDSLDTLRARIRRCGSDPLEGRSALLIRNAFEPRNWR